MKIKRELNGKLVYIRLTPDELQEAHEEFVRNFMENEFRDNYGTGGNSKFLAEAAYEIYSEGNALTEYESIQKSYDAFLKEIAGWMTATGLERTSSGNYHIYFSDLEKEYGFPEGWVKEHAEDIQDALDYAIVAECDLEEDAFSLTFYLQYCCEHCATYLGGNRSYENCQGICDCWCDEMKEM